MIEILSCRYKQGALSLDFLELLERFIPTEYDMKLIHNYEREGRPLDDLSEEDSFMVRFSKIPRLSQRISTLTFMGNFPDSVQLIQPVSSPALHHDLHLRPHGRNVYLRQEIEPTPLLLKSSITISSTRSSLSGSNSTPSSLRPCLSSLLAS